MNYTHRDLAKDGIKDLPKSFNRILEIGAGLDSFEDYFSSKRYVKIDNESEYKGDSIKMDALSPMIFKVLSLLPPSK